MLPQTPSRKKGGLLLRGGEGTGGEGKGGDPQGLVDTPHVPNPEKKTLAGSRTFAVDSWTNDVEL